MMAMPADGSEVLPCRGLDRHGLVVGERRGNHESGRPVVLRRSIEDPVVQDLEWGSDVERSVGALQDADVHLASGDVLLEQDAIVVPKRLGDRSVELFLVARA